MGAKQSAEMAKAKRLITEEGVTPYAAAQASGITRGAISKAKWYRDWIASKVAKKGKK